MEKKILSVSELNELIKEIIEIPEFFRNLYVRGEISNLNFNRSGHVYFSIKDELATIKCMVWKDNAHILKRWNLKDGMKVTCNGRITYYLAGGTISFEVRDISLEGKGELQKIYEERFNFLKKEGWFDESIKKNLPKFPKKIGIVTADSGAAIHDLISTITRRYPLVQIFLFPTQVQGEQARFDIAKKINQANNFSEKLDLLIVGRGGGSYEDLWSFNEMEVLTAVRNSNIPIISAVGHEPDITLIDYVADKRAATPTAAGELATPSVVELKQNLLAFYQDFKLQITNYLKLKEQALKKANTLISTSLSQILIMRMMDLQITYKQWKEKMRLFFEFKKTELINLEFQWQLTSPFEPLESGYSLIFDQKQVVVEDIQKLVIGQKINLKTKQGIVESQVRRVLLNKKENNDAK